MALKGFAAEYLVRPLKLAIQAKALPAGHATQIQLYTLLHSALCLILPFEEFSEKATPEPDARSKHKKTWDLANGNMLS